MVFIPRRIPKRVKQSISSITGNSPLISVKGSSTFGITDHCFKSKRWFLTDLKCTVMTHLSRMTTYVQGSKGQPCVKYRTNIVFKAFHFAVVYSSYKIIPVYIPLLDYYFLQHNCLKTVCLIKCF